MGEIEKQAKAFAAEDITVLPIVMNTREQILADMDLNKVKTPFLLDDGTVSDAASYLVTTYGHELSSVISHTIQRWDGQDAARRIELYVGRDLKFIRINGTVVGGLAGTIIYAAGNAVG